MGLPPKVCPLWDVTVEGRRLALSGGIRQTWLSEGVPKATTALIKTCPAPQALGAPGLMEERSGSGPPRGGQGVFRVSPRSSSPSLMCIFMTMFQQMARKHLEEGRLLLFLTKASYDLRVVQTVCQAGKQ